MDREPIGCVGQALQCQVKATLDPEPTPEEKKLMKYEWNLEGAEPSESLPHFSLEDDPNAPSDQLGEGRESIIVNLDGSVPADYHIANVSLTVYDEDDNVLASDSIDVKFTVINVDLENIPVSHSPNPDLDDPKRMCNNAQAEYKKVKYRATVKPDTTTAKVYSAAAASQASVTFQGITSGFNADAVKDGDEFWVVSGGSVGLYNIVLIHNLTPISDPNPCWTYAEDYVFKLVVEVGATSTSPGVTGNGTGGDYFVTQTANIGGLAHAADQEIRRFAWLVTEPAGKYSEYASAKLKVVETFQDRSTGYGLKIFNDVLPRTGDINFSLTYGIVTVALPPISDEQDMSVFKGEVRIKGPNDTSFVDAPTAQTQIKTSDLGFFQFTKIQPITTSSSKTTHINHYKVGDATSRLEAQSRATVSGGYIGGESGLLHGSWGDVKFNKVVEVIVDSDIELTTAATP